MANTPNRYEIGQPIDQGLIARISGKVRQWITGAKDVPFGPMEPLQQIFPAGSRPRNFDYDIGYNINVRPRRDAVITFDMMRNLAEADYLLRIIIETCKDEMVKIPFQFRRKRVPGKTKSQVLKESGQDKRITELHKFFEYPDQEHDWPTWLRLVLEDYYVIDALSIYPVKTKGGDIYAFEIIDGATINRLVDTEGRTPAPPDAAYQQNIKGFQAVALTADDLIYRPYNLRPHKFYGFSRVEQIIMLVNIGLRRDFFTLNWYTEGNVPEGFVMCPDTWTADQIRLAQEEFDAYLKGDLANRRRIVFTPGGTGAKLEFPKKESLKDEWDEWRARNYCYCFGKAPTSFVRANNRATAESAAKEAEAQGNKPTMDFIAVRINELVTRFWGYDDIEFAWLDERDENEQDAANIAKMYVSSGIKTPNEVRDELGLDPKEGGDELGVVTGSGFVPLTAQPEPDTSSPDGTTKPQGDPKGNGKGSQQSEPNTAAAAAEAKTQKLGKKKVSSRWSRSQ